MSKEAQVRILFVENHALFARTVITEFLSNHEVVVVPSFAEARVLNTSQFEALLVDFDLDDCKGDAVVRWIRSAGFIGPIVAVSSHEDGNAKLVSAGADAICTKIRFRSIEDVLEKALLVRSIA